MIMAGTGVAITIVIDLIVFRANGITVARAPRFCENKKIGRRNQAAPEYFRSARSLNDHPARQMS
jgi:hypothetical protein